MNETSQLITRVREGLAHCCPDRDRRHCEGCPYDDASTLYAQCMQRLRHDVDLLANSANSANSPRPTALVLADEIDAMASALHRASDDQLPGVLRTTLMRLLTAVREDTR